jgi:hypothetical protein
VSNKANGAIIQNRTTSKEISRKRSQFNRASLLGFVSREVEFVGGKKIFVSTKDDYTIASKFFECREETFVADKELLRANKDAFDANDDFFGTIKHNKSMVKEIFVVAKKLFESSKEEATRNMKLCATAKEIFEKLGEHFVLA